MADALVRGGEVAGIYARLAFARIRGDWQYRTSFVLFFVSQAAVTLIDFGAIAILFGRVEQLAGWSLAEVAFLYGTSGVAFAVADVFASAVERVSQRVKAGTFDRLLLRPVGPLIQLSADEFAVRRFGKVAQAAAVLVVSIGVLDIAWTPGRVVMVPVMLAAAVVIYSAVWVVTSSIAFWTVETQEFANAFTYGGNFLSQYPLPIYAGWLRRFLAFVVPIAFTGYLPALYVLGRTDPADRFGLPWPVVFASPAVAVVSAVVARAVWRAGLRHHRSTGS